jgi:hypothetical protein
MCVLTVVSLMLSSRPISAFEWPRGACMTTADTVDRGRESFGRRAWTDAFDKLSAANRETPLAPEDLERLATAAYLLGRDADSEDIWARAHHQWLRLGAAERAVRCAFWLAFSLLNRGELAGGGGGLARARRLLDDGHLDCVEQGYLLIPVAVQRFVEGDTATAYATFGQAAKIGDRFGDRDLATLALVGRGRACCGWGRPSRVWRCWTRRWSPSRPVRCHRSRLGASTAR